tara:strand:- start:309 stop:794 length:486 start_codon:yes stop_codon:yes gene_type:complete
MSWMMNDLICNDCGHQEYEVMYKRKDGPDDCPSCEKAMSVDLRGLRFAIHGQGPGSFAAVDFGVLGKAETKEDYDRCVKQIEDRFPGHTVNVEHETRAKKEERLDAIRHRSFMNKKSKSLDDKMMKEISAYRKVRSKEAIAKGEPNKKLPSAHALATGKAS